MSTIHEISEEDRERHYASLARRYALDAKMMRCKAALHVENKDDIVFWSTIFKHFLPDEKFLFIAGSRNEYGHDTFGVSQCLKYRKFLSDGFMICIDSDYRYLLGEPNIDINHYIFQTYTYSFENHHCYANGLNAVCDRVSQMPNRIFNFERFLKNYSNIIYEAFIWHLYFMKHDFSVFTRAEFCSLTDLANSKTFPSINENGDRALFELQMKIDRKINYLYRHYSHVNLTPYFEHYAQIGLTADTAYLFVRGHNIYDMIVKICKTVCFILIRKKNRKRNGNPQIASIYKGENSVEENIKRNFYYEAYIPIIKIEKDIFKRFSKESK